MLLSLQFLTTICTQHQVQQFCSFCNFFQAEKGVSIQSSNFLVEAAAKFGVLLATPRNEARKFPRNHASCTVLTSAFDAKTIIEKKLDTVQIF